MLRGKAPCYGCEDRWRDEVTSCHSTCKRYQAWKPQERVVDDSKSALWNYIKERKDSTLHKNGMQRKSKGKGYRK